MAEFDSQVYPGRLAAELGISFSDIASGRKAGVLHDQSITNDLVLELRKASKSSEQCAQDIIALSTPESHFKNCNLNSLRKKITDLVKQSKQKLANQHIIKNKEKAQNFLNAQFVPPLSKTEKLRKSAQNPENSNMITPVLATKILDQMKDCVAENSSLKRELADNETLRTENVALKEKVQVCEEICVDLSSAADRGLETVKDFEKLKKSHVKQKSELERLKVRISHQNDKLATYDTRNVNKRFNRRNQKIDNLEGTLTERIEQICDLTSQNELLWDIVTENSEKENTEMEKSIENEQLKTKVARMEQAEEEWRREKLNLQKQKSKLKTALNDARAIKADVTEQCKEQVFQLEGKMKTYEKEIKELEELVIFLEEDKMIKTFEDGKYKNEMRDCCMRLLTECNVSINRLPKVIQTVCQQLTGRLPEHMPSKAVLSKFYTEAKIVASKQVTEAMLRDFNPQDMAGNVLHQDATTKFHEHYEGMQITLKDGGTLTMGLKQVSGGDSKTYLAAFHDIINDLTGAITSNEAEANETRAKLISSIKCMMSDLCATNGVFNNEIHKIRSELLPAVTENWEQLSEGEKTDILSTAKFACRLHLLSNFATAADKALRSFEDSVVEGYNPHAFDKVESGTFRFATTSAKAFTQRGSATAGVHNYWEVFLASRDRKNQIIPFLGHRFNVAFHDGGATYFHRKDIEDFLNQWPDPNLLLKSVKFDVKEKVYMAGCRALGIIDKLVTGPLQRLLAREANTLSLNNDLHQMQLTLAEWSRDGSKPLNGEQMFNENHVSIKKDLLYDDLFKDSTDAELDSLTIMALELLCSEIQILLERQAQSQLPGGEHWQPDKKKVAMASNVPMTNVISERDMAILDNLLRIKPAASVTTLEASVMWANNKPAKWLDSLPSTEKEKHLDDARKLAPMYKELVRRRKEKLQQEILERLKKKQETKFQQEEKRHNNKFKITRELGQIGGIWLKHEIDEKIDALGKDLSQKEREKAACKALICQIVYHKSVLNSKGPRELFQQSSRGVKYGLDRLKQNLKTILETNNLDVSDVEASDVGLTYKPIDEIQETLVRKKQGLQEKLQTGRRKIGVQQAKSILPKLLENPELLVCKTVTHKCKENGVVDWFEADVLSVKKIHREPLKTEYNVRYHVDQDDVWHFPLLMDLKNGDLMIRRDDLKGLM